MFIYSFMEFKHPRQLTLPTNRQNFNYELSTVRIQCFESKQIFWTKDNISTPEEVGLSQQSIEAEYVHSMRS
jgi:hypothetical protein